MDPRLRGAGFGRVASWIPLLAFLLPLLAGPVGAADASHRVRVLIDSPAPGVTVHDVVHQARITGSAVANADAPRRYDVMLVIDVSESTKTASGIDVDGNGVVGVNPQLELLPPGTFPPDVLCTDPNDDILHAQVKAAEALLSGLDTHRVRVGVITFAGDVDPVTGREKRIGQKDAWLETPLTSDFSQVRRVLEGVLARGSHGATDYAAGLRLAIQELTGLPGARSKPAPGSRKVILFLTDGIPTLPYGRGNEEDPGDKEAAIRTAELARRAGILINTYGLGPEALRYPKVLTEMARITLGTYTPVEKPGDIIVLLQGTTFANVEDVVVTNLTTGDFSTDVKLNPDGSFTGYVPVREGRNRVRVSALATDGSKGSAEFSFDFSKTQVPEAAQAAELERIRRQNKALELRRLQVEIKAFRAQQRKEVQVAPAPEPKKEGGAKASRPSAP